MYILNLNNLIGTWKTVKLNIEFVDVNYCMVFQRIYWEISSYNDFIFWSIIWSES
jgi:hypothetical protein